MKQLIKNGPLSDVKGIVSFFVKKENWDEVQNRLKNIGYFNEFYFLDFDSIEQSNDTKIETINPLIWKGKKYSLKKLYIQDEKIYDTEALQKKPYIEYLLDILLRGSPNEKQQLLNGKEVTALGKAIERCKETEDAA